MLQLLVTGWLCVVVVVSSNRVDQLELALDALGRSLRYMGDRVDDINLDGVLGTRLVDEQLSAYLVYEPQKMVRIQKKVRKLRNQARQISDVGMNHVQKNEPRYSSRLGNVMMRSPKLMWYPSRNTNQRMMEKQLPCSMSVFNETVSDGCLQNIVGQRQKKNTCILTSFCEKMTTLPRQQGYRLTHQILYWQLAEMRNCIPRTDESLRLRLCSNVMRDANRIAKANYPRNHRDLFMEQIGLCGMWGFKDFYQPQWLKKIIQWQEPSGCYGTVAKWHCTDNILAEQYRVKRKEKKLDGDCLSHKTAVAVIALAVNIRFLAESIY